MFRRFPEARQKSKPMKKETKRNQNAKTGRKNKKLKTLLGGSIFIIGTKPLA